MSAVKTLLVIALALPLVNIVNAEARCPGNAASLRFAMNSRAQIIVPVFINRSGPYQFVLDTATHFTMIDPPLAEKLNLKFQATTDVSGIGFTGSASMANVESLQVGSWMVENTVVESQDFGRLTDAGIPIQGILGSSFLEHFDVLIDYAHDMLCLDSTPAMRTMMKGVRIPMESPQPERNEASLAGLVIVPIRLSGVGPGQIHLALDSGTNASYLYRQGRHLPITPCVKESGLSADGVKREYCILPSQNMQIGSLNLQQVTFVSAAHMETGQPRNQLDGILAASLFRRILIDYADRFVILEAR